MIAVPHDGADCPPHLREYLTEPKERDIGTAHLAESIRHVASDTHNCCPSVLIANVTRGLVDFNREPPSTPALKVLHETYHKFIVAEIARHQEAWGYFAILDLHGIADSAAKQDILLGTQHGKTVHAREVSDLFAKNQLREHLKRLGYSVQPLDHSIPEIYAGAVNYTLTRHCSQTPDVCGVQLEIARKHRTSEAARRQLAGCIACAIAEIAKSRHVSKERVEPAS